MALKVKSFRIQDEAGEQEMNRFLENKMVRQWSASVGADGSTWNVLIAFEPAREPAERGGNDRGGNERGQGRNDRSNDRNDRTNDRNGRGDRNDRNDRGNDRRNEPRADAPKREKPPRVEHVIDVAEADMPLYEAIRKWRNARAREAEVKPFNLFNNKQLEQLVKTKPASSDELKSILVDMDPALFDRYQHELLGFISGAGSGISSEPRNTTQEIVATAS